MAHEIRIQLSDEAYAALLAQAEEHQEEATALAARLLVDDLTEERFARGARSFAAEHSQGFAARFGAAGTGRNAA